MGTGSVNRSARWLGKWLPAILMFVALGLLWQFAVSVMGVREYLLPSPASVLWAITGNEIPWGRHIWVPALEMFGAFLIAAAAGISIGIMIAWSPVISRALMPFLVFVNTLPKVAVAPLFLIWMGYGILPNMLIGALIGFFPVVINTAVGLSQV